MKTARAVVPDPAADARFYLVLIMAAAALTISLVVPLALELHRNFLTIACDTADLQCAIVNTVHGHFLVKNGGPSLLASHTSFLLLGVIPAYLMAPSADTLFILQIVGVYATAVPIYLLALEIIGRPLVALVLTLIAMTSPIFIHMAMAPFHLETWIAAFIFTAILSYLRGSVPGYLMSLMLAVCCAEQAALIVLALGAGLLLIDDRRPWRQRCGVMALVLGVAWLGLDLFLVRSLSQHEPGAFNIFAYNYASFGVQGAAELPGALLHQPAKTAGLLFNYDRWWHMLSLAGLPLLAALLSRRSALLLAPAPAYLLMSDQEFFLYFHAYYFTFAFVAGYVGLMYLLARPGLPERVVVAVLVAVFVVNMLILTPATGYYIRLKGGAQPEFTAVVQAILRTIPSNAVVYTAHRYSAYLSNRQDMVIGDLHDPDTDFDTMLEKRFPETNVHARDVDFIVCDFLTDQCGWRNGYPNHDEFQARSDNVDRLVASRKWKVFFKEQDLAILERVR